MTENIDIRQRIGSELRALRISKGLSARELAQQIGITHSHVVRIENGKYAISIDTLNKFCQALGVAIQLTDNF